MLKILRVIFSLAKRLDAHLTRGVEEHGRHLAGLKAAGTARQLGHRSSARKPARPRPPRTGRPMVQFGPLGSPAQ